MVKSELATGKQKKGLPSRQKNKMKKKNSPEVIDGEVTNGEPIEVTLQVPLTKSQPPPPPSEAIIEDDDSTILLDAPAERRSAQTGSSVSNLRRKNAKKRAGSGDEVVQTSTAADSTADNRKNDTNSISRRQFRFSLRRTPSKVAKEVFEDIAGQSIRSSKAKSGVPYGIAQPDNDMDFRASFNLFDRDKNGTITVEEIGSVLKTLGQSATIDEIVEIIAEVDTDGDGKISFKEFRTLMQRHQESNDFHDNLFIEKTFHDFDVYGDGFIGRDDLRAVFRKLGDDEISNEELDEMLRDATCTPNRKVNLEEFKAVVRGTKNNCKSVKHGPSSGGSSTRLL